MNRNDIELTITLIITFGFLGFVLYGLVQLGGLVALIFILGLVSPIIYLVVRILGSPYEPNVTKESNKKESEIFDYTKLGANDKQKVGSVE